MALPTSGLLKFTDIATELGLSLSNLSLRSMSNTAGFSIPDAVSEFYGYSNFTYTFYLGLVYSGDPCSSLSLTYDIYEGSDGKYYADQGGTYVLASSVSNVWYVYSYFYNDGLQDIYVYDRYNAVNGEFNPYFTIESYCAPY